MKRFNATALLCCLLWAAGCSTLRVRTDYDPSVDFGAMTSYAWLPENPGVAGDPRLRDVELEARVRTTVDETLVAKGYRPATVGKADFLVGFKAQLEDRTETTLVDDYDRGSGEGDWEGEAGAYAAWRNQEAEQAIRVYQVGTLLLDVVDARTRKVAWRGTVEAQIERKQDPTEREKRIRAAMERMLSRFPPQ